MRCHVIMGCAALAANTLPAFVSGAYSVPVTAPLVCGILGGCGGAFLPADKGLKVAMPKPHRVALATSW